MVRERPSKSVFSIDAAPEYLFVQGGNG